MESAPLNTTGKTQAKQPEHQLSRNLLFEGVLVLVAIGLLLHFMVLPRRASIQTESASLSQLQAQYNSIQENTDQLDKLVQQMNGVDKDISQLDQALPLEPRITTVHVLLDSLVTASGLTLANISVDSTDSFVAAGDKSFLEDKYASAKKLQTVTVNLNVTGTMQQFISFLQALEKSARIIDVTNMDISANKDNLAAFHLSLKTYFYPSASSTAASGAPTP